MPLSKAQQAELIRSNQKDEFYQGHMRGSLLEIAQLFLGPHTWFKWQNEISTLADIGYFILTTLAGYQTLGEEYVSIVQLDPSQKAIPSKWRRAALISLHSLTPYLIDRALFWLSKELRGNPRLHLDPASRERLLQGISSLRYIITVIHRCHLAAFYLKGVFYHIAKRITGIRYVSVRGQSPPPHWGYKVLGWLALGQLSFTFLQGVLQLYRNPSNPGPLATKDSGLLLPLDELSDKHTVATAPNRTCSLCLEERKDSTATPCGHLFCWTCINEWCSSKPECPLCRDKFHISRLIYLQNFDTT